MTKKDISIKNSSVCGYVKTAVWMHHKDAYKTLREIARQELHKNSISGYEKIPGSSTPRNDSYTATYLPSKTHPSKTNKHAEEAKTNSFSTFFF